MPLNLNPGYYYGNEVEEYSVYCVPKTFLRGKRNRHREKRLGFTDEQQIAGAEIRGLPGGGPAGGWDAGGCFRLCATLKKIPKSTAKSAPPG